MKVYTMQDLDARFEDILNEVSDNQEHAVVALGEGRAVVLLPYEDWESMNAALKEVQSAPSTEKVWILADDVIKQVQKLARRKGVTEE